MDCPQCGHTLERVTDEIHHCNHCGWTISPRWSGYSNSYVHGSGQWRVGPTQRLLISAPGEKWPATAASFRYNLGDHQRDEVLSQPAQSKGSPFWVKFITAAFPAGVIAYRGVRLWRRLRKFTR